LLCHLGLESFLQLTSKIPLHTQRAWPIFRTILLSEIRSLLLSSGLFGDSKLCYFSLVSMLLVRWAYTYRKIRFHTLLVWWACTSSKMSLPTLLVWWACTSSKKSHPTLLVWWVSTSSKKSHPTLLVWWVCTSSKMSFHEHNQSSDPANEHEDNQSPDLANEHEYAQFHLRPSLPSTKNRKLSY
jgi:hypothetical protein